MNSGFESISGFLRNEKNENKIILFVLILISLFKIPALITSDIQPWDEGLYAIRVLSIYHFGDFLDQSRHCIANLLSGTHPPMLIWLGYFNTLIFGLNEFALRLTPFLFSLLTVVYLIKLGKEIFSFEAGFFASLIFLGTYLFSLYSKRFQFDFPFTFFVLSSFYYFILFINKDNKKYLIFSAMLFGLSLMVKSLVGLYIPLIIFIYYLFAGRKLNLNFSKILLFLSIGILIALPWHLYMLIRYGSDFSGFVLGYHIFSRLSEHHEGIKKKEFYYYFNILLNNIPIAIILIVFFLKDLKKGLKINHNIIFLWFWFLTGIITITIFKTKLETYLIPFLAPFCLLLVFYILKDEEKKISEKILILFLVLLNFIWFFTQNSRNELKNYLFNLEGSALFIIPLSLIVLFLLLFPLFRFISIRLNFKLFFISVIISFFIVMNIFYLIKIPVVENSFILSGIKKESLKSGRMKILYISTNYKFNPQFSYYFDGVDLGWDSKYNYELINLEEGTDKIRQKLDLLNNNEYLIIVERDNINEGSYKDTKLFIPEKFKLIKKQSGYELYMDL